MIVSRAILYQLSPESLLMIGAFALFLIQQMYKTLCPIEINMKQERRGAEIWVRKRGRIIDHKGSPELKVPFSKKNDIIPAPINDYMGAMKELFGLSSIVWYANPARGIFHPYKPEKKAAEAEYSYEDQLNDYVFNIKRPPLIPIQFQFDDYTPEYTNELYRNLRKEEALQIYAEKQTWLGAHASEIALIIIIICGIVMIQVSLEAQAGMMEPLRDAAEALRLYLPDVLSTAKEAQGTVPTVPAPT